MAEKKETYLIANEGNFIDSLSEKDAHAGRKEAYLKWKEMPAPTTRDEYWKYTRIGPVLKKTYEISGRVTEFNTRFIRDTDAYHLVFVNGVFSEEHSDNVIEDNFIVSNLEHIRNAKPELISRQNELIESHDYFSMLNTSFHQNGPFIWAGRNQKIDKSIHVVHVCNENARLVNIKGLVIAEVGSSVSIIETWDDDNGEESFINSRLDYHVEANAEVEVIKIQSVGGENSLINQDFVEQEKNSRFSAHTISMQGKLIRNNLNISLNGEGAESNMNGLYMVKGNEHVDNHTRINHAVPNCNSNELYKGILNEKAKGVFNGKVIVSRDAQKTNAFQYNGNILLTDECQVYSKPELEIYADDVKCSHGSTTGQLDQEALFYLQSRGIGKKNARNLLLQAFAREVLDKFPNEQVRERVDKYITERYQING